MYFVYGEELFVRERVMKRLRDLVAGKCGGQYERVDLSEIKIHDFINSLSDVSLFTALRLVVASEVSSLKNEDMLHLVKYCENPSPDIILLLLSYDVDRRKKNITSLISLTESCEAQHPREYEMDMWVKGMAAEHAKKISPEAIAFLKDKNGNDLSAVEKEIEKVSLFIDTKELIGLSDIETVSSGVSGASVFDLLPLIASGNKGKVLAMAHKLIALGENPVGILAVYIGRVKKMLLARELFDKGEADPVVTKEVGMPPFYFKNFKSEVMKYSYKELIGIYRRVLQLDMELKSSRREKLDVLSTGLLDVMNKI